MPEDFLNGLNVVPFDAGPSILSSIVVSLEHPWQDLYLEREPPPTYSTKSPYTNGAPLRYTEEFHLYGPPSRDDTANSTHSMQMRLFRGQGRAVELHETVRLCDVEAFRLGTAEKAREHLDNDQINALSAGLARISTSPMIPRPVIYRYIDVIKDSMALLEAIHFEIFLPDRLDLRFLAIPLTSVPSDTVEGDFFHIHSVDLLPNPSFAVKLGQEVFPVVWKAGAMGKIAFSSQFDPEGLAYIVKSKTNFQRGGEFAMSELSDCDFFIRESLFPNEHCRREHSLVRVTLKKLLTAHIYPVEPPIPLSKGDCTDTRLEGSFGHSVQNSRGGAKKEEEPRSEYLKRIAGAQSSSQRAGNVVSAVRALSSSDWARIDDRLGAFNGYGQEGDVEMMNELFKLGSRYRMSVSQGADARDAGEMKIDESIILKTISDTDIGSLEECLRLLDCIYGRRSGNNSASDRNQPVEQHAMCFVDGSILELNAAQSRAVSMYTDANGPQVFCILSPPGSGKTTVAAAMAAEVARSGDKIVSYMRGRVGAEGVQLLLSVQNVAVDNMGAVLKKLDYGGGQVYNMKSSKKLDPHNPAPCDFFDLMGKEELWKWKKNQIPMNAEVARRGRRREKSTEVVHFKTKEDLLTHHRREFEKNISPKIILSTVEMVLQKLYTSSKLCEEMGRVTRVIIDEASLLTEAALFCIIRRFPQARIVLIGDDKQLPPFMYDSKILGHELAGRPALTVAMKTGRVPVVELNEVYRAPPSLVAPYNRLAYGGKLVSRKAEGSSLLSSFGLMRFDFPQLLLIDVDGREERNERSMSLYNEKELDALVRLLRKIPREWTKDIMIICLYKDQKRRLQDILDKQYHQKRQQENQQTPNGHPPIHEDRYTVLTVDSAQGKESPIVILMTTRTQKATDFFCSTERCNVAISRQQKALIILGKVPLLATNYPWSTVISGDDFTRVRAEEIK